MLKYLIAAAALIAAPALACEVEDTSGYSVTQDRWINEVTIHGSDGVRTIEFGDHLQAATFVAVSQSVDFCILRKADPMTGGNDEETS